MGPRCHQRDGAREGDHAPASCFQLRPAGAAGMPYFAPSCREFRVERPGAAS